MATVCWEQYLADEGAAPAAIAGPYKVHFLGEVPASEVRYYDGGGGARVRVYRLRVRGRDGQEREVHRRFSQFQQLVESTPPLEWHLLPSRSFWRLRLSEHFRRQRSRQLSSLLRHAVELDSRASTAAMSDFLGLAALGSRQEVGATLRSVSSLQSIKEAGDEDGESTDASASADESSNCSASWTLSTTPNAGYKQ